MTKCPLDLLCLGEALVEFNETEPGLFRRGFGGDTSNVAIAAARQGAKVAYLSAVGADPFGDSLLSLWQAEGIVTDWVARDATAPTGHYFVTHGPSGHAFHYARAGSAASRMTPASLPREAIADADILHLSGISLAISETARQTCFAAIDTARAAGTKVSIDLNIRPALWPVERARQVLAQAMELADIVLPGAEDAGLLTGLTDDDEKVRAMRAMTPGLIAMTRAERGVLVHDGGTLTQIEGLPVPLVDATGAGDTFDGVFLAALSSGASPVAAARRANAAAALSVTRYGAIDGIPGAADVTETLRVQASLLGE